MYSKICNHSQALIQAEGLINEQIQRIRVLYQYELCFCAFLTSNNLFINFIEVHGAKPHNLCNQA